MSNDTRVATGPGEPLALWMREGRAPSPGTRRLDFEFASRGDRVPGRLLLPAGPRTGPAPLILLQHGAGGSRDAPYLDAAARPWVRAGAAVASIDFPLHGERASDKLTGWLLAALSTSPLQVPDSPLQELWREFARQAVLDLRRALDALESLPEIDAHRIAYASFSLGSLVGAVFCAQDTRPCAAALALGGAGLGPPDLDPGRHVGRIAPRPLLFVNASDDERIPRAAAEALFAAAKQPKRMVWVKAGHSDLPGSALKAMWSFLSRHLGVAADGAGRAGSRRRPGRATRPG